jgi:viroplasmin and RNaseH domain-containing protein
LQSQVSQLYKKVSSAEEAKRYWRVMVDSQKDAENDMRSQVSAADRERVEAEIKRRKVIKLVSRLKWNIKAMFEADREDATEELDSTGGGRCDVEGSSDDDAEELPHRRSQQQRERPSGLPYKLRHAPTRAIVRRYVGRKAEQREQWLTQVVGDDDSLQRVFRDSAEEAGDRCGKGERGRVELRE